MLFVSRHKNYRHEIWGGDQRFVRSAGGAEALVTTFPNFTAEFKPGRLTEVERQSAARQFGFSSYGTDTQILPNTVDMGDPDAPGAPAYKTAAAATAMPYANDGIMIGAVGQPGDAYVGYDPQFHMASFNTDEDIDYSVIGAKTEVEREAAKAECERRLMSSSDFGSAFCLVNERTIPLPWPSYGDLKGESKATIDKIISIVRDTNHDAAYVHEYERVVDARPKVLAALEELANEQHAQQQLAAEERAALQATVV